MKHGIRTLNDIIGRCYVDERGCWIWRGATNNATVPIAKIGAKVLTVLRLAYCLKHGIDYHSLGKVRVWSKSRESLDVNPANAMVGTVSDHNKWRAEGGRLRGPLNRIRALKARDKVGRRYTPEQIAEIRASSETEVVLSQRYVCSPTLIGHIRRGRIYNNQAAAASVFSWALAA